MYLPINSLGYPRIKKLQRDNLWHAYNMPINFYSERFESTTSGSFRLSLVRAVILLQVWSLSEVILFSQAFPSCVFQNGSSWLICPFLKNLPYFYKTTNYFSILNMGGETYTWRCQIQLEFSHFKGPTKTLDLYLLSFNIIECPSGSKSSNLKY